LQLNAFVLPANATNKNITWSLINDTGLATISNTGLVTAIDNGSVTALATANDGSGIFGSIVITLSNQIVPVTSITVNGSGGASIITNDNGSLQLIETVLPFNATNKSVTWSIINGTGEATISSIGLVTAVSNGDVTVFANANDGTGISANLIITIYNQLTPVTGITVAGAGGANTISTDHGSLQMIATVLPATASEKSVTWSIVNGTGRATINATGLLTALDNGLVTVIAEANDGSGVKGTLPISILNQMGPVTSIIVTGAGGATSITSDNGSLQLIANVLPSNATVKTVTWSFVNNTGLANINSTGLLTAVSNGIVTIMATAMDGSGVYGTLDVTISNQFISVTSIAISGDGGVSNISTDNGTLQLIADLLPLNATDKSVTWSMINGSGEAIINASGLVIAVHNGTVFARATSNDGSGVYGIMTITISNQITPVAGISVSGAGGSNMITFDNGTLQLYTEVLPVNATNKTVTWSILNGSGEARIDNYGLVTAVTNGTVSAIATANDGSGVFGALSITISNQITPVNHVAITTEGGTNSINSYNGTLQLNAVVLPSNATDKSVTWSLINGSGKATISSTGLVTAVSSGVITAKATSNDGTGIYGLLNISIAIKKAEFPPLFITSDEIKIILNADYLSWNFSMYNFQGGKLISKPITSNIIVLDVSSIPTGFYLLVLSNGIDLEVTKIVKP
jgi:uncharacterized protein YjdB